MVPTHTSSPCILLTVTLFPSSKQGRIITTIHRRDMSSVNTPTLPNPAWSIHRKSPRRNFLPANRDIEFLSPPSLSLSIYIHPSSSQIEILLSPTSRYFCLGSCRTRNGRNREGKITQSTSDSSRIPAGPDLFALFGSLSLSFSLTPSSFSCLSRFARCATYIFIRIV